MNFVTDKFVFNGYEATVICPEKPNGKWIYKTEFLYAFDKAERELSDLGYTRVYYAISNKYGSAEAVELMRAFCIEVALRYGLSKKTVLFGFSRGGLYAFNFALKYPELVDKVYLDAPVLDLKTWPPENSREQAEMFTEYNISSLNELTTNPIDRIPEFFDKKIPLLIVAGGADEVVPYIKNAGRIVEYCLKNGIDLKYFVKPDCKHHPHSLENVDAIIRFVEANS